MPSSGKKWHHHVVMKMTAIRGNLFASNRDRSEIREPLPDLFRHLFDGTSAVRHHQRSSLGCGDGDENHTCQHHDVYLQDRKKAFFIIQHNQEA